MRTKLLEAVAAVSFATRVVAKIQQHESGKADLEFPGGDGPGDLAGLSQGPMPGIPHCQ